MIKVNEDFRIEADTYCYTVSKRTKPKEDKNKEDKEPEDKKDRFVAWSYQSTIEGCINAIIRDLQREKCKEDLSLHEYLEECKKINEEMKMILQGIREVEVV